MFKLVTVPWAPTSVAAKQKAAGQRGGNPWRLSAWLQIVHKADNKHGTIDGYLQGSNSYSDCCPILLLQDIDFLSLRLHCESGPSPFLQVKKWNLILPKRPVPTSTSSKSISECPLSATLFLYSLRVARGELGMCKLVFVLVEMAKI